MVILTFKGCMCKPHNYKNMRNSLSLIQTEGSSKGRVGGPPGANISDIPRGVTSPGIKSLVSVEDI